MVQDRVLEGFSEIATLRDDEIDLARAALLIASTEYPALDIEMELGLLDSLAGVASALVGSGGGPLALVNRLSEYLFDELGFRGDEDDYRDPRNSFLNDVLKRRRGIPISLSLLYIEVGKRLGAPLLGIGMPGHFLVRHRDVDDLFVDPFHGGVLLSVEECAQRLRDLRGVQVEWHQRYLDPVTNREFISRMLRNLKAVYLGREDLRRSLTVLDLLVVLQGEAGLERRDRGLVRYRLGQLAEALEDLEAYAAWDPSAKEAPAVQQLVARIMRELGG